jgi:transcriptional regulator with XRE-family HTH domain
VPGKIFSGMDIKKKIGLRIKELRTEKELTQEGLAWNAEINRTFMNHVENGRKNVSIESLEKIISGLGTSLKEFFNSKEFSKP